MPQTFCILGIHQRENSKDGSPFWSLGLYEFAEGCKLGTGSLALDQSVGEALQARSNWAKLANREYDLVVAEGEIRSVNQRVAENGKTYHDYVGVPGESGKLVLRAVPKGTTNGPRPGLTLENIDFDGI